MNPVICFQISYILSFNKMEITSSWASTKAANELKTRQLQFYSVDSEFARSLALHKNGSNCYRNFCCIFGGDIFSGMQHAQ
jgi:hypothetical protein